MKSAPIGGEILDCDQNIRLKNRKSFFFPGRIGLINSLDPEFGTTIVVGRLWLKSFQRLHWNFSAWVGNYTGFVLFRCNSVYLEARPAGAKSTGHGQYNTGPKFRKKARRDGSATLNSGQRGTTTMQGSKQQNEFEDLQRDFRRVDAIYKLYVDWLDEIGPTQTNFFQLRSCGVRHFSGLGSKAEAKGVLSQLSSTLGGNPV